MRIGARALVTGSDGFVGRHMVKALREREYDLVECIDLVDHHDARDYFRRSELTFDLVVHCAAVVGGRTMIEGDPLTLAVEDLTLDAELFRWAMRTRPGRIVYFSSSAAYPVWYQTGEVEHRLAEDDIDWGSNFAGMPDQTYGWVKLTGERLAREADAAGIPVHVFRPFSGYGADQALDYPFPAIVERARRREDPLIIWSDAVRDFVYIDDVVATVLAAIDADERGPLNICTGVATSFADLARLVAREVGYEPEIEVLDDRPTGVQYRVGDPTRMLALREPTVDLVEGVRRALARAA